MIKKAMKQEKNAERKTQLHSLFKRMVGLRNCFHKDEFLPGHTFLHTTPLLQFHLFLCLVKLNYDSVIFILNLTWNLLSQMPKKSYFTL